MKKSGFILFIMIAVFLFNGCGTVGEQTDAKSSIDESEPFMEGKHPRTETYAAEFDTMCKNYESLTVQIAADIFEEDSGEAIYEQVQSDYCLLLEAVKDMEPELTVYVVEQTIDGKPQVFENELFCSKDDIESGAYRTYLAKSCLRLHSMWQCIGLSDALFLSEEEKNQIDTDKLREYYSDSENKNTMSLFPSYFVEEFADEETRTAAEDTAYLLTQYILDNHGLDEYLMNGENVAYRNEWLDSIGVEEALPWTNEDMQNISNIDFTITAYQPLIVTIDTWNFYLEPTDWLVTAEDAYLFVKDSMDGYPLLLQKFKDCGIDDIPVVAENLKKDKTIRLKNSTSTYSNAGQSTVTIRHPYDIWHEMVHVLIPLALQNKNTWLNEGLAEYFSRPIQAQSAHNSAEWREAVFAYLTDEDAEWETEGMLSFKEHMIQLYEKQMGGLPAKAEEVDTAFFYDMLAKSKALKRDVEAGMPIADLPSYAHGYKSNDSTSPEEVASALSYVEAYLFVQYLIEKYGAESVITLTAGHSFETAFGSSYQEEYLEWQDSLAEEADDIWGKH